MSSQSIINIFSPVSLKKALQRKTQGNKDKQIQIQVEQFFAGYFEEFPKPKHEVERELKRRYRKQQKKARRASVKCC